MKVGTDGVLLGAWANCAHTRHILDVGSGSGLIALMLAQRSDAHIDAIDIDSGAFEQSKFNFEASVFAPRLQAFHTALQDFTPKQPYDLIVSNPPYFSNSLKADSKERNHARHNDSLPVADLFTKASTLLNPSGRIAIIYPFGDFEQVHAIAEAHSLFLSRKTTVYPTPGSEPKRILLEYSQTAATPSENSFYIEQARHLYSDEYIRLTEAFYLNM